ncbi:MAG: hypothetical protein WC686_02485 [Candidatus Shapirobacteria bacterium]|jgi:hypothetical protein
MPDIITNPTLLNLQSLIRNTEARLNELQKTNQTLKEMVDALLENDPSYVELDKQSKKAQKEKSVAKQQILKTPSAKETVEKIKDNQFQIKDLKVALSDYLAQYVIESGSRQVEDSNGQLLDIIYTAKLVKRK